MDRIRQALDRARFERSSSERAPSEPMRFENPPPLQLCHLQFAEAASVQRRADDHAESPALSEAEYSPENPPASSEVPPDSAPGIDLDSAIARLTQTELIVWEKSQAATRAEGSTLDKMWSLKGSHPSSYAPLVVSLVLGILIAADLARASRLLLPATTRTAPPLVRSGSPPQREVLDVHDIVAAHLFGEASDPDTQDPANAPLTKANLLLAGTLAAENPKRGLAIISIDGRSTTFRVGDSLADGDLHSVYRDHVVLRRRGILETLVFPKLRLARAADGASTPTIAATAADATVAAIEPSHSRSRTGDVLNGVASALPDGRLRGFRIYPSKNRRVFVESGLRPGDLVVAVNGASLEDQDVSAGQQMFNSMKTSSQATLTVIDRTGARRDITVSGPSVAAD